MALIVPWRGIVPTIDPDAWIAPTATVIGDVHLGAGSSLWFGTIVRGDVHFIRIGRGTNIQDGSVVHVTTNRFPTQIGDDVLIGHMSMIHGCTIESGAFVGMKACVMDGAVIESGAMVAAGALVTPGRRVKSGELWGGSPAKLLRPMTEAEREHVANAPKRYARIAAEYKSAGVT
ncbi:MAG: gamma carbonic anhydrase family protein [Alphaproteobacteria bacterium]|nr:gamma carbonic anhydrase family protein [Alphaproteobacteria bacterium]